MMRKIANSVKSKADSDIKEINVALGKANNDLQTAITADTNIDPKATQLVKDEVKDAKNAAQKAVTTIGTATTGLLLAAITAKGQLDIAEGRAKQAAVDAKTNMILSRPKKMRLNHS
uniref:Uncharacterized protein n=1 Tax=Ditylenchus dipsaci TaxID=166011 RepID=A0A915EA88_9BILA